MIRPPLPSYRGAPPHLSTQFPCCYSLSAKAKKLGIERPNSSRGARRLPPSRRFKLQSLRVASNETCLLKARSFPANAPNVVAMRSGKQTHSEGQCGEWSAVYHTSGPKAESSLSQGPRPAFVKIFYTPCVRVQTHHTNFLETYIKQRKGKYSHNNPIIQVLSSVRCSNS